MSTGSIKGINCKVTLGATTVLGIGTWNLTGISAEAIDNSEFTEEFKTYEMGQKDGGQVTFNGLLKPGDTTGQDVLLKYLVNGTNFTSLRCYLNTTSYYSPCATSGYLSPTSTTGNPTMLSHVNVTAVEINADKTGLLQISFTAKVSGLMVLV